MKIQLGVEDIAYADPDTPGTTTTGQVAGWLEKKYHVMRVFWELEEQSIASDMAERISDAIESMAHGMPFEHALKNLNVDKIEQKFSAYLDADTWQKVSGQTIAAAVAGVSHRFKDNPMNAKFMRVGGGKNGKGATMALRPGEQRGARPAFIDTGQYQASFRAKVVE